MVNGRSNGFGLVSLTPILIYLIISALIGAAIYFFVLKKPAKEVQPTQPVQTTQPARQIPMEYPLGLGKDIKKYTKSSFTKIHNKAKSRFGNEPEGELVMTSMDSTPQPTIYTPYSDSTPTQTIFTPYSDSTPEPTIYTPYSDSIPTQTIFTPYSDSTPEPTIYTPYSDSIPTQTIFTPYSDSTPQPTMFTLYSDSTPTQTIYTPYSDSTPQPTMFTLYSDSTPTQTIFTSQPEFPTPYSVEATPTTTIFSPASYSDSTQYPEPTNSTQYPEPTNSTQYPEPTNSTQYPEPTPYPNYIPKKVVTKYSDGTEIKNIPQPYALSFIDGTYPTDEQTIAQQIVILKVQKIYDDAQNDVNEMGKMKIVDVDGINPKTIEETNKINKILNKYTSYLRHEFIKTFAYLNIYGSKLNKMYDYCEKNPTELSCERMLGSQDYANSYIGAMLNIDLKNKKTSIGNGWDEYKVNDFSVTTGGANLPINFNLDKNKKIKLIAFKYLGTEDTPTGEVFSMVQVKPTGTDYDNKPLTQFNSDTSFFDNRQSFNYNLDTLPYVYPVTLSNITIMLTCPGKSAAIKDFSIVFVYE